MQWLLINQETFIWINKEIGLIYDTGKFVSFTFNLNARITEICNELLCPCNLNSTIITSEDLSNENTFNWITTLVYKYQIGKLINENNKRPISLSPILKLQNDVNFYKNEHNIGEGGSIVRNIHELYFYINPTISGNNNFYKQLPYPLKEGPLLGMDKILQFVKSCNNPFLLNVSLVGNIFTYPNYGRFVDKIAGLVKNVIINITYIDLISHKNQLLELSMLQNISINVLFDCHPYNLIELHEFTFHMKLIFLVLSEVNYNQISEIINDIPDNYEAQIVPIFNGGNIDFFEKYVFTSQEDLNTIKITKREVFIHQTLNSNDFGKIFILPDGSVHTNVNFEPLGSINNSPYSIVFKEITEGNSWLRIRNQKPCTNCIYQWLCPSPNNYELAFGKPNLCNINL